MLQNHVVVESIERKKEKKKIQYIITEKLSDLPRQLELRLLHSSPNLARRQDKVQMRDINYPYI